MSTRKQGTVLKIAGIILTTLLLMAWIEREMKASLFFKFGRLQECSSPVTNIVFLKTHKTAGSTVTSILNMYSDLNDLTIAIPVGKNSRFGWPFKFHHNFVDTSRLKKSLAQVLTNHAVFEKHEISLVIKKPSKMITILRNPAEQLTSCFYYENLTQFYDLSHVADPVLQFMRCPECYTKKNPSTQLNEYQIMLKNGMAYDLGFSAFHNSHPYKIKSPFNQSMSQFQESIEQQQQELNIYRDFIQYIDKSFDMVLIAEYFNEGLMLLRKKFCWKLMDMVYEKKLVNEARPKVVDATRSLIIKRNQLDWLLYQSFKSKMEAEMKEYGEERLSVETEQFKQLNQLVNRFCAGEKNLTKRNITSFLKEIHEQPVKMFMDDPQCYCKKLHKSEVEYQSYFKMKFPSQYFGHSRLRIKEFLRNPPRFPKELC